MTPSLLPDSIRLGPVRLRVADRRRSGEWLARVLGLSLLGETGGHEVWGGRDGTPLVELREHPGARPIPQGGRPGIYHYAILCPTAPSWAASSRISMPTASSTPTPTTW